eukprot:363767-Chlamydomonas_euryale.AAC.3
MHPGAQHLMATSMATVSNSLSAESVTSLQMVWTQMTAVDSVEYATKQKACHHPPGCKLGQSSRFTPWQCLCPSGGQINAGGRALEGRLGIQTRTAANVGTIHTACPTPAGARSRAHADVGIAEPWPLQPPATQPAAARTTRLPRRSPEQLLPRPAVCFLSIADRPAQPWLRNRARFEICALLRAPCDRTGQLRAPAPPACDRCSALSEVICLATSAAWAAPVRRRSRPSRTG